MKVGTQVLVRLYVGSIPAVEDATVCRKTKDMLPIPDGYIPVRFLDGRRLLAHESRIVQEAA